VLEKQLSDKAELESKLAVALQQLEDYKAKAEMFDTVVGTTPEPTASDTTHVEATTEHIQTATPEPIVASAPVVEPAATKTEDPLAAVASAAEEAPVGMTVLENEGAHIGQPSPVGATALAIEERPALKIETNPIIEIKDPLEKIDGIGQVYQTKLYEAGIKTFAQLAAASPSRITEVVEPQNWQTIDIMKWRREAALYAAGEKV
jgi:predicted flap endonuclease-1-like 5' DNA nuclease